MNSCALHATRNEIHELRSRPPRPLARGTVCQFTRHARAITRTATIPMRAAAIRVLDVLLADAGPEGWCWRSPAEIQAVIPRSNLRQEYSLASVLRSLYELRAAGFLTWRTLKVNQRFPLRVGKGKASKVVWGKGRSSEHGGRVFMLDLDALTAAAGRPRLRVVKDAPELERQSMDDRAGTIIHDRPSDRLRVSSETRRVEEETNPDPAPAALAEDTRPEGRADETRRDPPRERDSHALRAGTEASETPGFAAEPAPMPRDPKRSAPPERRGGTKEHDPGQLLVHPLTAAPMLLRFASEDDPMEWLPRGGACHQHRDPKKRRAPPLEQRIRRTVGPPPLRLLEGGLPSPGGGRSEPEGGDGS